MKEDTLDREKTAFLERVFDIARRTLGPEKLLREIPPCPLYSAEDIEGFVNEEMPEMDMRTFRDHCQGCRSCAVQLFQSTQKKIQRQEEAENRYLLKGIKDRIDRIARRKVLAASPVMKPGKANILHIFIDAVGNTLFPVMTTGEQLTQLPAYGLRSQGSHEPVEPHQAVMIIKDFSAAGVSVQVNLIGREKGKAGLEISVFDKDHDVFLAGVVVGLERNSAMEQTSMTDDHGRAFFMIQVPEEEDPEPSVHYQINLLKDDLSVCRIQLDIKRSGSKWEQLKETIGYLSKKPMDESQDDLSGAVKITLDIESGMLEIPDAGITLKPHLPLDDFLRASIDHTRDELLTDEDRGLYAVALEDHYLLDGMLARIYLTFVDGALMRVGIRNASKYYEREIFTWATEVERKKAHDEWIAAHIGSSLKRPWGEVISYYDEAAWGAVIFLIY